MADQMADRKVIVLEEPPEPVFERMLDGKLGIDEYLMGGSRHRVSRIWSRRQSTDEKAVHTEKDHQTNRIASAEPV